MVTWSPLSSAVMPSPQLQSTFTRFPVRVTLVTRCFSAVVENGFMIREPILKMSVTLALVTVSSCAIRSATAAETWPIRFWAM